MHLPLAGRARPTGAAGEVLARCPVALLARGPVVVDGVLLLLGDDRVHAVAPRCPHLGMPLQDAEVRDGTLTCRAHGGRYRLEDGRAVRGPCRRPLPVHRVEVEDGQVVVSAALPRPGRLRALLAAVRRWR